MEMLLSGELLVEDIATCPALFGSRLKKPLEKCVFRKGILMNMLCVSICDPRASLTILFPPIPW